MAEQNGVSRDIPAAEAAEFVRQLFAHLVDLPLQSDAQAQLQASAIAAATCDTNSGPMHLAYSCVSRERQAAHKMLGSGRG